MSDKAGHEVPAAAVPRPLVQPLLRFTLAEGALILLIAIGFNTWVWHDAASQGAVRASAWLAFAVQIITFAVVRLVAREQVIAGWGLGVLIRFATAAGWAFLGVKALGLPPVPALISLVTFYFVSTLIEPLFLNG